MENTNQNVEELFKPALSHIYMDKFQELILRMGNAYADYRVRILKEEIETLQISEESDVEEIKYVASLRVLLDLVQQGWVMDIRDEEEHIRRTEEYAEKLLTRLEANIKDALNDIYVKDLGYHRNTNAYVETDLSSIEDYSEIAEKIKNCYDNGNACIIAANEYPFLKLEKAMEQKYPEIAEQIRDVKKNSIVYGVPSFECGQIVVVDLNDRNLLDREKKTILAAVDKLIGLLEESKGINHILDENIQALTNELVREG